jgi:hypothetical protein
MLLMSCFTAMACGKPEDPARVQLRERLKDPMRLSPDELGHVREEVGRTIQDMKVRVKEATGTRDLDQDQRTVVLGMLTDAAGMYDEGLRAEAGKTFRILNAPGVSNNAEIEASRKLWIDVETFLPERFDFVFAFPGNGDYSFDLVVER